jgi:hypothetical protein
MTDDTDRRRTARRVGQVATWACAVWSVSAAVYIAVTVS